MKKSIVAALLLCATISHASVITNYVYVVSNIFNNVYSTQVITQKVKSTHTNYYFTNYVSVVTNVYQSTFNTNIEVNVIFDNFEPYVRAASNQANRASSFAASAASSATAASGSASSAAASAASAAVSADAANTAATNGIATINERIEWFDEHSGETITIVTTNVDIHVDTYGHPYVSPDGVTTNANFIYYPIANENGKVAITTIGNYKPSICYAVKPYNCSSCFVFEPAFVDTDVNGMRLHYLPKTASTITSTIAYDRGETYLPRDFYWQNGELFLVIENYSGTTWQGTLVIKYAGTGSYLYPNSFGESTSDTTTSSPPLQRMAVVSREGTIMAHATGSQYPAMIKTAYGYAMPSNDSVLWFAENPTIAQQVIIDWLATWTR